MDLWVVAAATGAGYLAKYWNKISKSGDGSCHASLEDSGFENPVSPSCPFPLAKQEQTGELGKDVYFDGRASDLNTCDGLLTGEVASKRGPGGEKMLHFQSYNKHDVLSISNLAMPLSPYDDNFKDVDDGNEQSSGLVGDGGLLFPDSSAGMVPIHDNSSGHKTFIRMKHSSGRVYRPLNKEHVETEEYVFGSLSSASTASRSFLVSNGSQIINRKDDNFFSVLIGSKEYNLQKEAGQVKDENVFGVPSLPKIKSVNDAKEMKFNAAIGRSQRSSSSENLLSGKYILTQQYDKTLLFSLGISFGMIASISANKRETDKLRELLKQTENLVQDLQEELEMKDSMTVKELQNENYGLQDTCDRSSYDKELNEFSPEKHVDNSPRTDSKQYHQKVEQSSESMSKIEAELEAELERLGLDMNASSLERKLSELVELDPEFVADFAQGELRADMVSGKDSVHPKSNEDASDQTPLPANYAVLPHELSLRLHEVIQSQLEQRVNELEIALENSQRKVRHLEAKEEGYLQKASSFTRGNDDCDFMSQPLILNLSGEALDAYNEAYEELIKINDSEENSPLGIHDGSDHMEGSHSHDWHALGVQHSGANGSNMVTMMEGHGSSIYELDGIEDESCGFDDKEVEEQLIRQIVERTKKGSPVLKNAQRMLYSTDEDEQ
ncbi:hypothetical protein VNO78_02771 [Psophocarpus tetragonolobus]|uniref:Uncharacterized protein n=1 Tax=Psophocarpus tetragonolobus TaxID=3891 RepID=A0AAN9T0D7_PSOTE